MFHHSWRSVSLLALCDAIKLQSTFFYFLAVVSLSLESLGPKGPEWGRRGGWGGRKGPDKRLPFRWLIIEQGGKPLPYQYHCSSNLCVCVLSCCCSGNSTVKSLIVSAAQLKIFFFTVAPFKSSDRYLQRFWNLRSDLCSPFFYYILNKNLRSPFKLKVIRHYLITSSSPFWSEFTSFFFVGVMKWEFRGGEESLSAYWRMRKRRRIPRGKCKGRGKRGDA